MYNNNIIDKIKDLIKDYHNENFNSSLKLKYIVLDALYNAYEKDDITIEKRITIYHKLIDKYVDIVSHDGELVDTDTLLECLTTIDDAPSIVKNKFNTDVSVDDTNIRMYPEDGYIYLSALLYLKLIDGDVPSILNIINRISKCRQYAPAIDPIELYLGGNLDKLERLIEHAEVIPSFLRDYANLIELQQFGPMAGLEILVNAYSDTLEDRKNNNNNKKKVVNIEEKKSSIKKKIIIAAGVIGVAAIGYAAYKYFENTGEVSVEY